MIESKKRLSVVLGDETATLSDQPSVSVEALLGRMRDGDRVAAGVFVERYGSRIRRRIRGKLNQRMRRLFDSQDILSTIRRRLDRYVMQGHMDAVVLDQLWSLIFRITDNAMVEKARLFHALKSREGNDSEFASMLAMRMRDAERMSRSGVEDVLETAFRLLEDSESRRVLGLWLADVPLTEIGEIIDEDPSVVRKRWQRIKARLRAGFEAETN